ncbi:unnamed protein product [Soboliphyme baturini]|uniref:Disintegrin domain-containing protein n=1 Tax=Soboliphyme baturini TaxID=241478 RepID=A0A183ISZ1_9BILA|nr:unnamed protein product [Soboliphyme baturini]
MAQREVVQLYEEVGKPEELNDTLVRKTDDGVDIADVVSDSFNFSGATRFLKEPPVANCSEFGFECKNHKEKIATRQRCDGIKQCSDGSDEEFCQECLTSFSCPALRGGKMCFRGDKLCDGVKDCDSALDESNLYCKSECQEGLEYKCKGTGRCIPFSWVCDGDPHCPEEDDELQCSSAASCSNNAHWCAADKRCIPEWAWCDGVNNCSDGSDEAECSCLECSGKSVALCTAPRGTCILRSKLCNGEADCPNEEDERNCPGWCEAADVPKVMCIDGNSYPKKYACSGLVAACQNSCAACDPEVAFQCGTTNTCISRHKVCDGLTHCLDGSDESKELCECVEGDSFLCPGLQAKCIPKKFQCDGFHDCINGEDEENCSSCYNNERAFYCNVTRTCYPSLSRCNGIVECEDYSDEDNCACEECKYQLNYNTFMCQEKNRCLSREYVCNPKSPYNCPGSDPEDERYCYKSSATVVDS